MSGRSVGSPAAARMLRMSSTANGVDGSFWMTIVPSWWGNASTLGGSCVSSIGNSGPK